MPRDSVLHSHKYTQTHLATFILVFIITIRVSERREKNVIVLKRYCGDAVDPSFDLFCIFFFRAACLFLLFDPMHAWLNSRHHHIIEKVYCNLVNKCRTQYKYKTNVYVNVSGLILNAMLFD